MKFYAHYCKLGCNAVYANDTSKYCGDYYAFPSKKARDEWLEEHEWDNYPNWTAREATRAEVVSQLGKDFTISEAAAARRDAEKKYFAPRQKKADEIIKENKNEK